MNEYINIILNDKKELFGNDPVVQKINIGFTNTVYKINNSFIVKICTDYSNEEDFVKEINFYESNKNNTLIPKLYYYSIDKDIIPYMYEIIEKIEGVSLYNVWHTLTELERENIISQLCDAMKIFHSNIGSGYDWGEYFKKQFVLLLDKVKVLNVLDFDELVLLESIYSKFDEYLEPREFVLVHNDLHFDNIFYHEGKIKLIDFERSMYAPKDFELDILYRMVRMPWKFASEETEKYTKLEDYSMIMKYIDKYYSEIITIPNLYKRLAIYDVVYFLEQFVKHPEINELKDNVMNSAKEIIKE